MRNTCETCGGLGHIYVVDYDYDLDGNAWVDGRHIEECPDCKENHVYICKFRYFGGVLIAEAWKTEDLARNAYASHVKAGATEVFLIIDGEDEELYFKP